MHAPCFQDANGFIKLQVSQAIGCSQFDPSTNEAMFALSVRAPISIVYRFLQGCCIVWDSEFRVIYKKSRKRIHGNKIFELVSSHLAPVLLEINACIL